MVITLSAVFCPAVPCENTWCFTSAGVEEGCESLSPSVTFFYFHFNSLALSSLNKHTEAVVYYKKALELDPDNDTYKSNLKIAEQKMKETPSPVSSESNTEAEMRRNGGFFPALLQVLGCV